MKLIPFLVAISGLSLSAASFADSTAETTAMPAGNEAITSTPAATAPADADTMDTPAATDTTATSTANETTAETMTEQAGFSRGSVVRSIFTSAIQEREPIDKLNSSKAEAEQIFYFTELRDMSGQTATHRWEYDGKVVAEVKFDVRGPRWRVWSSKSFTPGWAGDWKVSVINGAGETISEEMVNMAGLPAPVATEAPDAVPAEAIDASATENTAEPAAQEFEPPVTDQLLQ